MNNECVHIKGKSSKAIVMFHGYGADMNDLAPLHQVLDPNGEWHWYFPNGPLRIPFGVQWEGRAWFPIDMAELERAMQSGRHRDFSGLSSPEFTRAVSGMESFVREISSQHTEVVIGGFSQGAMGASHVAARGAVPVTGLVLLSSTLVDQDALKTYPAQDIPFYQSHGDSDALLGFKAAQALFDVLTQQGMKGIWQPFRGGHEIPQNVLMGLRSFLLSVLK